MQTWCMNYNETPAHINVVTGSLVFFSQIKTKHRYVWTKREFTEQGSALGELVDQVSLFISAVYFIFHRRCGLSHPLRNFNQYIQFW